MSSKKYIHTPPFRLESGELIEKLEIQYHAIGTLNEDRSNVIWVFHALTANSDVSDWWSGLLGEEGVFDLENNFVICANILGSCYGTTGPTSIDPKTDEPYLRTFPHFTIRDMANAHILLMESLGVTTIKLGIGGSMGGYQLLECMHIVPDLFQKVVLLVTSARESAWGIAIHTVHRRAIELDPTWADQSDINAGARGLSVARGIGMLMYRNFETYKNKQTDTDDRISNFKAESYIDYQGKKLVERFNTTSYWYLTHAMDTHNIGRDRGGVEKVLSEMKPEVAVIGISSDLLCDVSEQKYIAQHIPNAYYYEIDSLYGHDGFLLEFRQIGAILKDFLGKEEDKSFFRK